MNRVKCSIQIVLTCCIVAVLSACGPGDNNIQAVLPPNIDIPRAPLPTPTEVDTDESNPVAFGESVAEREIDAVTWNPESAPLSLPTIAEGLTQPLFVTHAGDGSGRLFIVEQPGRIRILQDEMLIKTAFLDITERVNDGANERGLLGLAFSPEYRTDGLFFVNYTDSNGDTVIARFKVSATSNDIADAESETLILRVDQPASNHNGGMLAFGPDGYLYIGLGDGGGANDRYGHGQNPATLLGKMLRIDVNTGGELPYQIPNDNPWVAMDWDENDVRDEIVAVGLRNPWRFSFDRENGDLWIGDVGQNQWEEVNRVAAGDQGAQNFGWPIMEGNHCFKSDDCDPARLQAPIAEYSHADGCSVTGGYVYRGVNYPALRGVYFFGDYCSGRIWATSEQNDASYETDEVLDTDLSISSFGEDELGELYITDLSGGTIHRLMIAEN